MRTSARLLVVDDDANNRDMLSRRLLRAGYEADVACDGSEALRMVETGRYGLVLLDIQMPDMSGLEVLTALRARFPSSHLSVIMATANAQSQDVVEALGLGADDYVTKPIDMPILLARIKTQLTRQTVERRLHDREQQYALAVEGANDGLWDWKIAEDQVYFSPRWKGILGCEDEDIPNVIESWYERLHPGDADRVRWELQQHLDGKTHHFESEHRLRHRNGDYRWVRCRAAAVRDQEGRPLRVAGSLADITGGKIADPLTGLANRVLFLDRLQRLIEQGKRRIDDGRYAVMFIDLDRFKLINDSMGHVAGDQLLIAAGQRMEHCLRTVDTVARVPDELTSSDVPGETIARLGGDEFAIALSDLRGHQDVTVIVDRLLAAFAQPFIVNGREVFVSLSMGIALESPDYERAEQVLHDADTAMYYAKIRGKGRAEIFDSAMRERAIARLEIENDLRLALERGELVVHYQPIVRLEQGTVTAFEALVRWNHPVRGLISPGEFIPVAEESGLINGVGEYVLREACQQLRAWDTAALSARGLTMAVNVSGRQFSDPQMIERIERVLQETGVDPHRIELELTESAVMADPERAQTMLEHLKALGVRLSIDDFGTGYSSLSHLQQFPVDRLKIDRVFISEAEHSAKHEQVLATIVSLARRLGLEVVAEGIESESQADHLRDLSCELGQGFYFSQPVTRAKAESLLERFNGHANTEDVA